MSLQPRRKLNPFARQFMFATGIENSYPTDLVARWQNFPR